MKTITDFENDVKKFFKKFEKKFIDNPIFSETFKGYQVFFSPLKTGAKIWIIGINPGSGYFDEWNELNRQTKPLESNEYFEGKYNVANSFRKLFEEDLEDLELLKYDTVISNLHFICTPNQTSLNSLLAKSNLGDDFYEEYWGKVKLWNDFLWNYIKPNIILSFGKTPIVDYFSYHYGTTEFNTNDSEFTGSPHWCYKTENSSIPIIQIERTQSSIINRQKLAEMIKFILAGK